MRIQSHRGFTLIELVAALGITVVIGGVLASTIFTTFRVKRSADAALAAARAGDVTTEVVRQDFEHAVPPTGIFASQFMGEFDYVLFYASGGDSAQLMPGDMKKVEIYLSSDPTLQRTLVRRVTTNLTPGDTTALAPEEPLFRDVIAFSLLYYDGVDWYDTWDSTQHKDVNDLDAAPVAVQMQITLKPDGKEEQRLTITASIPCGQLSTSSAMGGTGGSL